MSIKGDFAVAGIIFASLFAASSAFADLRFQPLILTHEGYSYSQPRGINDYGTIVGAAYNTYTNAPDGVNSRAIVWDAITGTGSLLGTPAGFTGTTANDINNSGVIVGNAVASATTTLMMRYSSDAFTVPNVNTIGNLYSVNDAGAAVGQSNNQPALLSGTSIVDLNGTSASSGTAFGISSSGIIVGSETLSSSTPYPIQARQFTQGSNPASLHSTGHSSHAYAVNANGVTVGTVRPLAFSNEVYPVILTEQGYVPLPGGFTGNSDRSGVPLAINDQGWIVGTEGSPFASTANSLGSLWLDDAYHLVNDLLPDSYAGLMKINRVTAINNRGQLAAIGSIDADGDPTTPGRIGVSLRLDPIRSPGDTNYDDVVDFDDLLTLAQHYGQSGNGNVFWETGDFNYDWSVDFDDLLTLAQNYGSRASFEADWTLAQSMAPEPSAMLTLAPLLLTRRRW